MIVINKEILLIKTRNSLGEFRITPTKIVSRARRQARALWLYLTFSVISRVSRRRLICPDNDIVVNLTSYGARLHQVHLMLESIATGTLRPGRIILWLDPEDFDKIDDHQNIQRAMHRGLEVRQGDKRYRAHNKYYNFVVSKESGYLLTADDDVFYPRRWLEQLWATFNKGQCAEVAAHWTTQPRFVDEQLLPFSKWDAVSDLEGKIGRISFGVSGVLFPDVLKQVLLTQGEAFLQAAPLADDVWISRCALVGRIPVRQCSTSSLTAIVVPFTQQNNLASENVINGGNDRQVQASYTTKEQAILKSIYDVRR